MREREGGRGREGGREGLRDPEGGREGEGGRGRREDGERKEGGIQATFVSLVLKSLCKCSYICVAIYIYGACFHGCRITNSPIADVFVVWAKTGEEGEIRGFILDKVRLHITFYLSISLPLRPSVCPSICSCLGLRGGGQNVTPKMLP